MGTRIVKLPDVGEGVAEAEIVEWHVEVGQSVLEDQVLAAVMTDKATVEIPSPVAGTIVALGGEVGRRAEPCSRRQPLLRDSESSHRYMRSPAMRASRASHN